MGVLPAACLLLLGTCLTSAHTQGRLMPYIYPGGSVIQFAMGLALPADVKGRNVATNSGILINIDLPTNLSQPRPPTRAARSLREDRLAPLLSLSADPTGCLAELECYRRTFSKSQGLLPEILNSILESILKSLRLCGYPMVWLNDKNIIYKMLDYLLFILNLYMIGLMGYSLYNVEKFKELPIIIVQGSVLVTAVLLRAYFVPFQQDFDRFVSSLDELTRRILHSGLGHQEAFEAALRAHCRFYTRFTRTLLIFNMVCAVFFVVPLPGVQRKRGPILTGFEGPESEDNPLTILVKVLILITSGLKKVGIDCFFITLFRLQVLFSKHMTLVMMDLSMREVVSYSEIVDWIKMHQNLHRCIRSLLKLFSPVILIYYSNLLVMFAISIYIGVKDEDADLIMKAFDFGWVLTVLILLYIQSAASNDLAAESEKAADCTYNILFYNMDKRIANAMRMIILYSIQPIRVTAYSSPIFTMDKESFLSCGVVAVPTNLKH